MNISGLFTTILLTGLIAGPAHAKNDHGHGQSLPPGLQKNVNRGKPLPPGWQKKLAKGHVLDRAVYDHAVIVKPLDSRGLVTVRLEGKLVRLYAATREIAEVLN